MAAAHVAGAFAVLRSIAPSSAVSPLLEALRTTGRLDIDPENGVSTPRIRILAAGASLLDTGLRVVDETSGGRLGVAAAGVGLRSATAGSVVLTGIPAGAVPLATNVVWTTIGGPDPAITVNGDSLTGILAGVSADTGWDIDRRQPNRTYRAVLGAPLGNGTYPVGGVGGSGASQGQGVSLVTVYRVGTSTTAAGHVYQRFGASTACGVRSAGATLVTAGSGTHAVPPVVVVGVGDGQATQEKPLKLAGVSITSASVFAGAAGPHWDVLRIPVMPELVPLSGKAQLTLKSVDDCLVLSHVALVYEPSEPRS